MSFLRNKNSLAVLGIFILILLTGFTFVNQNEVVGLKLPESAFLYKNYIYVSNIGSSPTSSNLDGFIAKLDRYGNILEYKFIDGLKAPKGIFPYKNKLYISDLDRVCIASIDDGSKQCVNIPGSKFLNDIYVLNGDAYITDTFTNCIYKLDNSFNVSVFLCSKDRNFSPNGIWFSKVLNAFVVVSFNEPVVNIVSLNGKVEKKIYLKGLTGFDGLIIHSSRVFISDYRSGKIIETDLSFKGYRTIKQFNTPVADFFLGKNLLIAPLLEDNTLFIGKIK